MEVLQLTDAIGRLVLLISGVYRHQITLRIASRGVDFSSIAQYGPLVLSAALDPSLQVRTHGRNLTDQEGYLLDNRVVSKLDLVKLGLADGN